jgi:hypothetical protein
MAVGMKPGKVEAAWNGVLIPLRVSGTKSWVELQVSGATILKEAGCDGAISCTVYIKNCFCICSQMPFPIPYMPISVFGLTNDNATTLVP